MANEITLEEKLFFPNYTGPHQAGSNTAIKRVSKRFGKAADRVSMIQEVVDGVPVIMAEFGDKAFVNVVKSIGTFTNRISPSFLSTPGVMETWHGQPRISFDQPRSSADYIAVLYSGAGASPETLVFGPGVETCAYLGAALNAPVLPTQFTVSASSLEEIERQANPKHTYMVGHEKDWKNLCVTIKPQHLGPLYGEMIARAKNVIIFSGNSGDRCEHGTPRGWVKDNIHLVDVNPTTPKNYVELIDDPEGRDYQAVHDMFPDITTALHLDQIMNLEEYAVNEGCRVATISSGDWRGMIPTLLYKSLFEKSELLPKGVTFGANHTFHPYYERTQLRIPVIDFMYGADEYVEEFHTLLDSIDFYCGEIVDFLTWSSAFNRSSVTPPDELFKSWGFAINYKNTRPYDIWRWGWEDSSDMSCPTREYILLKIKEIPSNYVFDFLSFDETISTIREVKKTNFTFYG